MVSRNRNKKQPTKKNKNKEKKITFKEEEDSNQRKQNENYLENENKEENKSNKDDFIWITLLEEQMNKYDVELSSINNSNSESEDNSIDINKESKLETEKETSPILESNIEIKEKESNNTSYKAINKTYNQNDLNTKVNINIIKDDRVIYNGKQFKNIKKFNKNNNKRKIKKLYINVKIIVKKKN